MAGGCLLRLLVIVGVTVLCLATNCTFVPDRGEIGPGEWKIVDELQVLGGNGARLWLFMAPEDEFEGVSVEGIGSREITSFWFPSKTHIDCFKRHGFDVWRVEVLCTLHKEVQSLWCYMMAGDCRFSCWKHRVSNDLLSVRVVAYGPSKWRNVPPPVGCKLKPLITAVHSDACWLPPVNHTSIPTSVTVHVSEVAVSSTSLPGVLIGVATAAVLLLLGMVAAVIVLVLKIRAHRARNMRTPTIPARRNLPAGGVTACLRRNDADQEDGLYVEIINQPGTEGVYEEIRGEGHYLDPLPSPRRPRREPIE